MSEQTPKVYSLLALSQSLQNLIREKIGNRHFWLKAELAQVKQSSSGHWYIELVQERQGIQLAAMQAMIWSLDYSQILNRRGKEVEKLLIKGQELVMQVMVDYHPVYGLKLLIKDLDLSFTLGELERRKRATIQKLKNEGVLDLQKRLSDKMVWQNIAVLSSENAAAYQDFIEHLRQNEFGYRLQTELYPIPVQGPSAADEISQRLKHIYGKDYDLIVIIRGGGSPLDLDSFNDEALARTVADCPIPIQSGIGHEKDVSVLDLAAFRAHKTPTALADHLIDKMSAYEKQLQQFAERIQLMSVEALKDHNQKMLRFTEYLNLLPIGQIRTKRGDVHQLGSLMVRLSADGLRRQELKLEGLQTLLKEKPSLILHKHTDLLNQVQSDLNRSGNSQLERIERDLKELMGRLEILKPERTLERGYTITRIGSKSINSINHIKAGDLIETQLKDGIIQSQILKINTNEGG